MGMYITVTGVYNHYPNLFELMRLPDGVDMETARDNILFQCGELELVYSEPSFLRAMIGNWSKRRAYKWKTLQGTTTLEYNPIENYDRQEEWSDTDTSTRKETGESTAEGNTNTSGNNTEKRKGFEGGDLVETAGAVDSSSAETSSTGSSTIDETNNKQSQHTGHAHGNIGVTTSQQMLMSERDVAEFSIYDVIAQDFAREFCLYVY